MQGHIIHNYNLNTLSFTIICSVVSEEKIFKEDYRTDGRQTESDGKSLAWLLVRWTRNATPFECNLEKLSTTPPEARHKNNISSYTFTNY